MQFLKSYLRLVLLIRACKRKIMSEIQNIHKILVMVLSINLSTILLDMAEIFNECLLHSNFY